MAISNAVRREVANSTEWKISAVAAHRAVVDAEGVPQWAKAVMHTLIRHANSKTGQTYIAYATIMRKAGVSRQTVGRALNLLTGLGWITRQHRTKKDGGLTSNLYIIHLGAEEQAPVPFVQPDSSHPSKSSRRRTPRSTPPVLHGARPPYSTEHTKALTPKALTPEALQDEREGRTNKRAAPQDAGKTSGQGVGNGVLPTATVVEDAAAPPVMTRREAGKEELTNMEYRGLDGKGKKQAKIEQVNQESREVLDRVKSGAEPQKHERPAHGRAPGSPLRERTPIGANDILAEFAEIVKAKYGWNPVIKRPRDLKVINGLIQQQGPEVAREIIRWGASNWESLQSRNKMYRNTLPEITKIEYLTTSILPHLDKAKLLGVQEPDKQESKRIERGGFRRAW